MRKELLKEKLFFGIFRISTYMMILILFAILLLIIISGAQVIDINFLTSNWSHLNITEGGIYPAIVGSLILGLGVIVVSFPLGIGTAIYLTEYSKDGFLKHLILLAIRNLAGVPSIVYGLFGLAFFVQFLSMGTSLGAAIMTLSIMALPWIITSSVEALESIPVRFRESSLALGATHWQSVFRIVLPAALPGCITGGIISTARALGETAPIILVGATFYLTDLPASLSDKFMALPYHTFVLATQHSSPHAQAYAAGTSLVLILLTLILSLAGIIVRYYFRKQKTW